MSAPQDETWDRHSAEMERIRANERIRTLETENASLLKRATEAENSASAANVRSLIKRAEAAERESVEVRNLGQRMVDECDEAQLAARKLQEERDEARRLHDQHCPLVNLQPPAPQKCVPPWRQGR